VLARWTLPGVVESPLVVWRVSYIKAPPSSTPIFVPAESSALPFDNLCVHAAAMGLNPKGRNWGSLVNWDDLGKAYAAVLVIWTVALCAGTAWLVVNRRIPFIKMRNLPLAIASTAFLHVYLVKIMLAYTTNGHFTCAAEFWIMSIYLPFGIALFQANITQLRSISYRQSRILSRQMSQTSFESLPSVKKASKMSKVSSLWTRWRCLNDVEKSYVFIGFFMLVQVREAYMILHSGLSLTSPQLVMTGALYASSPVLQGDWSSFGHLSYAKGQSKCRKSLEWLVKCSAQSPATHTDTIPGSHPLSGSSSGLGYTGLMCSTRSRTSTTHITGACRPC